MEIINNTFYSPNQTNIMVNGGSANVEILNNILWTGGGYDLDIANDSHSGFFSDYNDLYTTGSGQIVALPGRGVSLSILDWQNDVAAVRPPLDRHDGRNPTWAQPHSVELGI